MRIGLVVLFSLACTCAFNVEDTLDTLHSMEDETDYYAHEFKHSHGQAPHTKHEVSPERLKIQKQLESFEKTRSVTSSRIAVAAAAATSAEAADQSSERLKTQAREVEIPGIYDYDIGGEEESTAALPQVEDIAKLTDTAASTGLPPMTSFEVDAEAGMIP